MPATTSAFTFSDAAAVEFNSGLNDIGPFDADALRLQLQQSGYAVFTLPHTSADNRRAFFEAVRSTLPLDPPLQHDNWDALSDSLFYGLLAHPSQRLAILCPTAQPTAASAADFNRPLKSSAISHSA